MALQSRVADAEENHTTGMPVSNAPDTPGPKNADASRLITRAQCKETNTLFPGRRDSEPIRSSRISKILLVSLVVSSKALAALNCF